MKQVLIWMLGLCLLFVGASCKDGSGQAASRMDGALALSFDLATEVPLAADHFQVVGLDRDGKVIFGPTYVRKSAAVQLAGVPVGVTKIEVTFLIGTTPIGMVAAGVDLASGSAHVDFRAMVTTEVERLQSLVISPTSAEIAVRGVQDFHAMGLFSDGASYDLTAVVTWLSGASAVATVDAGGRATGVAAGAVGITASLDSVTSNRAELTVTAAVGPALLPTISSVTPHEGPESGGTMVTIIGKNLLGATAVSFGGTAASSFEVDSDTQIVATSPAGTAGSVSVQVSTPKGTSTASDADSFTYFALPIVQSVTPLAGKQAGGEAVVITGQHFIGVTGVRFGGNAASAFTVDSTTQISAIAPSGAGLADVIVASEKGESATGVSARYRYLPIPMLSSRDPGNGPAAGGNPVVLTGSGFAEASAVMFGDTLADFTVVSDTAVTATAPAGTGTVSLTVRTPGGTTAGLDYAYLPIPALSELAPLAGPEAGGNTVQLLGSGFTSATGVMFGENAATSYEVVSDTELSAVAPAGTGTARVTVVTSGGISNALDYRYAALPAVGSASPTFGPVTGGNPITLQGSGLLGATAVRFGNVAASSFVVTSDTALSVIAPAGSATVGITVVTAGGVSAAVSYQYLPIPALTSVSPALGPQLGGAVVTLIGSGFDGATAVNFGTLPALSFTVFSNTQITATVPAGTGPVAVTVATPVGTTNAFTYTYLAVPVLGSLAPGQGPLTGGNPVRLTGSRFTSASEVRFGALAASSFTIVSDTRIDATPPAGTGPVMVTVITPGGASNEETYEYVPGPALLSLAPIHGPEAGGNTIALSGGDFTGTTEVSFGSTPATSFTVVSAGQIDAVAPAGAGDVDITVTNAGGTSNALVYTYVPRPELVALTPAVGRSIGGTAITITGLHLAAANEVHFGTVPATSFSVVSDSEIVAIAGPGTGVVEVSVRTAGGTSEVLPFTYTTILPVIAALAPSSGPLIGGNSVTIVGSGFSDATTVNFGTSTSPFTLVSDTQITATPPAGSGVVSVTVATPSGLSNPFPYTYVPPPTLDTVTPNAGPEAGGGTVLLDGEALDLVTAVTFGGVAASFTVVSDQQLSVQVPAGSGVVDVTVTSLAGTDSLVGGYEYVPAPTLSAVSPAVGGQAGGVTVTISGTNLLDTAAVLFGATPATSFTAVSSTQVTAVSPAGTGTVDVTLSSVGGSATLTGAFHFAGSPGIASLSPTAGPAGGGNTLTITGNELESATGVHFLGFGVVPVASATATQVTVVVPGLSGGATFNASVLTPGGESNTLPYASVTPPVIATLTPSAGPVLGGASVTIVGTGFLSTDEVMFDGAAATSFTIDSATQITAVAPAGAVGAVDVVVRNPGGSATSVAGFTYFPAPGLGGLSDLGGSVAGGQTVTLTGTGFTGATQVLFGGVSAASFSVISPTQIVAVTPAGVSGGVNVVVTTPGGTSNALSFAYADAPVILQVLPSSGPLVGGNTISIGGLALDSTYGVLVDNAPASFTVVDDEELTVVVPAGSQGYVDVVVQTFGGSATASSAYQYVPASDFVFSPNMGREAGGDLMTLNGIYLAGVSEVRFGNTPATFQVISPVTLQVTTPAGTGTVDITVTTPGGSTTKLAAFTYEPVPTISSVSPNVGPTAGGTTVTITGTGLTNALSVAFGSNLSTPTSTSSTQLTVVVPAGIAGAVNVVVTTPGGDSNGQSFSYFDGPNLTSVSPVAGSTAGGNTVVLTGSGLTGTTDVTFDGVAASFTVVSDTQIDAVAPVASPGAVDIVVTNPGGSATAVSAYTYATSPTLSALSPSAGSVAGGAAITATGTNLADVTSVSVGGTPAVSFVVVTPTQLAFVAPAGTGPGATSVTVTNSGGTSNGLTFTYVTPASLVDIQPAAGPEAGGNTVVFDGDDFTTVQRVVFGGNDASITIDNDEQLTVIVPAGLGTVDVEIISAAGTSTFLAAYTYVPPAAFTILPSVGRESGGETITLTGSNLLTATDVLFGSTPATSFTVDSDSQITVVTPMGTGATDVTVVSPGGSTTEPAGFTFVPPPVTTSLSDAIGPSSGGNTLALTGNYLDTTTAVLFDGVPGNILSATLTQVDVIAPASAPATVTVEVVTAGGSATNLSYQYVDGPTISALTPTGGATTGGTTVTITGSSFSHTTAVYFDGTPASFTIDSDTQVTVVSPAGAAGAVDVVVENPGGSATAAGAFSYAATPSLSGISPNAGAVAGGNTITLVGTNLTGVTAVSVGGAPASSFTVVTPTQIIALSPAHVAGAVSVTVTSAGGTSNSVTFTYVDPPTISSLSQNSGDTSGGYLITINGTNLSTTSAVYFDQSPGSNVTVLSDTQVQVMVPSSGILGAVDVAVETVGGLATAVGAFTYTP